MWPCVVAPGKAGVGTRASSWSLMLLHGFFVHQLHEITINYHRKQMWPTYTLIILQPSENHTVLSKPRERTTSHRCANYPTLSLSCITLPPPKKKNHACIVGDSTTSQSGVLWLALEWDEIEMMWGSGKWAPILPLFRSRASSCSSHSEASTTVSQQLSFWPWSSFCWCLLGFQPAAAHVTSWTPSAIRRACSDCRRESTVKVHQTTMFWMLWLGLTMVPKSLETPALWPGLSVRYHCSSCLAGRTIWKRGRDFNFTILFFMLSL